MAQTRNVNRKIVLNSRPVGSPSPENFQIVEDEVPTLREGQVLLRTVYLSLDPYMRGRMSDTPSYAPPVALGEVLVGGTIGRVVHSDNPKFHEGDLVLGNAGWQDYALSNGDDLVALGDAAHPSH